MMAIIAVVWSIGFIAYSFIFDYFAQWSGKLLTTAGPTFGTRHRFLQNLLVFVGYALAGVLAFSSIIVCAVTLGNDSPSLIPLAWQFFVAALVAHLALFTFEVFTSIKHVLLRLW